VREPAPQLEAGHREDLEALIDLLRVAVDLEGHCDYGDRAGAERRNRECFIAHFTDLEDQLRDWEDTVERVQAAPGSLWSWYERAIARRGLSEPPFAIGALTDRLAILTSERARHGQLQTPYELHTQHFRARSGDVGQVSIYVEGQNVARMAGEPHESVHRQIDAATRQVQALFDEAQATREAAEISSARDALLDLKQPLLESLAAHASMDAIEFAAGCPRCRSVLLASEA